MLVAASSGDAGNVTNWPSTSPAVLSVGGTTLTRDTSSTRGWTESAWAEGGSGCSLYEAKPDFQLSVDTGCGNRADTDIAADADPETGLGVYDTAGQSGWLQVGGTSLSSPLVTGIAALAGAPPSGSRPVTFPYLDTHASADLNDVTTGSDGDCGTVLCTAGAGWDGPTGLGTPNGTGALSSGPHGDLVGTVTDAATGKPVANAVVTAQPGSHTTRTAADGGYDLTVAGGTYDLSATGFGYAAASHGAVAVADGGTASTDFALTALPHSTVSGTVTDGSGHGWPLYATVTIDGYPGGPLYTDPVTGRYSVDLPTPGTYQVHVASALPGVTAADDGYLPADTQLALTSGGSTTKDVALRADTATCVAPGYGRTGLDEDFTGTTGNVPAGWSVTGGGTGWSTANPAGRAAVAGGDDRFAVADASRGTVDTTLTSPPVDLSGQAAPTLTFLSGYYGAAGQSAQVQVSTDNRHWTTVWHAATGNAIGAQSVPLPTAKGAGQARVRFHFSGRGGWWWSLDDIALGASGCQAVPGALLVGTVTSTGGDAVPDATLTVAGATAPGIATVTGDPRLPVSYHLFSPSTGTRAVTVSAPGYTATTTSLNLAANAVTRHDWTLTPTGGTR